MIQALYHGVISTKLWIYHMYNNKHTRQKSLKKYMKSWRSRLARLNDKFDTYIKENYKVVDYQIKTPSMREHDLTWKPYGYYKRRKAMLTRSRCIALRTTQIIEARSAMDRKERLKMEFDTDSFDILIDNCCSHTLTNDINDYIEPPVKSNVRIRGYNGTTNSTMVGTVKWKIKDDKGKIHNFILPNTYYSSSVETRLLSPQHWEQTRKKGRDSCCFTYHDAIIMRWNKDKYQITVPLDNRKHRNMGVVRSADIKQSLTSCQAIYQEFTTLAYPTTICMDYQAAEVTDDEASVEAPKASQSKSEKTMDEVRPVMPTETSTKLALSIPFDGDPSNVHRFKMDFVDHLKNVGLKSEFNVRVGENPRPDAIAEDAWQADPNRFVVQSILDTYAGISLPLSIPLAFVFKIFF